MNDDLTANIRETLDISRSALLQAQAVLGLLKMVIEDMETCRGERGADYVFQELSSETVEALNTWAKG